MLALADPFADVVGSLETGRRSILSAGTDPLRSPSSLDVMLAVVGLGTPAEAGVDKERGFAGDSKRRAGCLAGAADGRTIGAATIGRMGRLIAFAASVPNSLAGPLLAAGSPERKGWMLLVGRKDARAGFASGAAMGFAGMDTGLDKCLAIGTARTADGACVETTVAEVDLTRAGPRVETRTEDPARTRGETPVAAGANDALLPRTIFASGFVESLVALRGMKGVLGESMRSIKALVVPPAASWTNGDPLDNIWAGVVPCRIRGVFTVLPGVFIGVLRIVIGTSG